MEKTKLSTTSKLKKCSTWVDVFSYFQPVLSPSVAWYIGAAEAWEEWSTFLSWLLLMTLFSLSLIWDDLKCLRSQMRQSPEVLLVWSRGTVISWGKRCPIQLGWGVGNRRSGSSGIRRNNLWERLKDINLQLCALATAMWVTSCF